MLGPEVVNLKLNRVSEEGETEASRMLYCGKRFQVAGFGWAGLGWAGHYLKPDGASAPELTVYKGRQV